jgi:hypothetical protein
VEEDMMSHDEVWLKNPRFFQLEDAGTYASYE